MISSLRSCYECEVLATSFSQPWYIRTGEGGLVCTDPSDLPTCSVCGQCTRVAELMAIAAIEDGGYAAVFEADTLIPCPLLPFS